MTDGIIQKAFSNIDAYRLSELRPTYIQEVLDAVERILIAKINLAFEEHRPETIRFAKLHLHELRERLIGDQK